MSSYSRVSAVKVRLKVLFHSSQKPTRKLAARIFIQSQYLKALAASLRVGFCDEWKRGLRKCVYITGARLGKCLLAIQISGLVSCSTSARKLIRSWLLL